MSRFGPKAMIRVSSTIVNAFVCLAVAVGMLASPTLLLAQSANACAAPA